MGAVVSSIVGSDADGGARGTALGDLPESCVAEVLIHLDPPEICRLARLSRAFRGAAAADAIWGAKLPRNYGYLIVKASGEADLEWVVSKKEIYARLCRRNPFDGGTKEFWLEKQKGRICMLISSRALSITGIDDRRYWNYIPTEESRFHAVAYLQQVWWLEVRGEIDFLFPEGTYSLFFRLHLGRASKRLGLRVCNPVHIHGWDIKPVLFQLSTSDGQEAQSKCYLDEPGVWVHYHVGDFVVKDFDAPLNVRFSMTQIDCTHTKGGLCVDSVLIQPKV
ncbi:F-box protein PP2-A13-like [Typha angustifolia]|uniref:F-box protein PP2-A13-like n=1 Tax=Typha angustifolia TaxID=59011 RepID=UPI003C2ECB26